MKEQRTFYIRASRPLGHPFPILSWLIRLFTWAQYSHVFFTLPLKSKVFHSYFNHTRYENPEYLNKVHTIHQYKIDVSKEDYAKLISVLDTFVGKRRGYLLQLFGISLTLPFRILGIRLGNPFWIFYSSITCSQMMSQALVESGILKKEDFPKWYSGLLTEKDMVKVLDRLVESPSGNAIVRRIK